MTKEEWRFQSTLPAGEATSTNNGVTGLAEISIHASRGGSDIYNSRRWRAVAFQSTLPAGEATCPAVFDVLFPPEFQSTLPAGEATGQRDFLLILLHISIHASRGGSDFRIS